MSLGSVGAGAVWGVGCDSREHPGGRRVCSDLGELLRSGVDEPLTKEI